MVPTKVVLSILLTVIVSLTIGCESRDERLAEYAQQATNQQARQNEEMARQSQQVARQSQELAEAAHSLVEQDAAARRELIEAQSELQTQFHEERTSIDEQREELHAQRRAVAAATVREPVVAQAILVTGLVLATLLPLIVTAYALRRLPDPGPSDSRLADTLIESLEAEHVRLSSSGPQPEPPAGSHAPRLGGPGSASDPEAVSAESSDS